MIISQMRERVQKYGITLKFEDKKIDNLVLLSDALASLPTEAGTYTIKYLTSTSVEHINGFDNITFTSPRIYVESENFSICKQPISDWNIFTKLQEGKYIMYRNDYGYAEYIIKLDKNKKQKIVYKILDCKIIAIRYMKYGKYEFSISNENGNYTVTIQNNGEGAVENIARMINYMKQTPPYAIYSFKMKCTYTLVSQTRYKSLPDFTNTDVLSYSLMIKPVCENSYEIKSENTGLAVFGTVSEYDRNNNLSRIIRIFDYKVRDEYIYGNGSDHYRVNHGYKIMVRVCDTPGNGTLYEYSLDNKLKSIYTEYRSASCKITVVDEHNITISGKYPANCDNIAFAAGHGQWPIQFGLFRYW